jgi:hypothetical protein
MVPSLHRLGAFTIVSMFLTSTIAWSDPILVSWNGDAQANLTYHNYQDDVFLGTSTGGFALQPSGTTSPWSFGAEAVLFAGDDLTFTRAETHHAGSVSATGLTAGGSLRARANNGPAWDGFDGLHAFAEGSLVVSFDLLRPYRYSYDLLLRRFDSVGTSSGTASLRGPAGFIFEAFDLFEGSGDGQLGAGNYEFTVTGHGASDVDDAHIHNHTNGYLYDFALNL